jgi:phospholipid/cholesterol/gamma-HCH transport system permease protein
VESDTPTFGEARQPDATAFFAPSRFGFLTRQFLTLSQGLYGLGRFAFLTISVGIAKIFRSRNVVWPEIRRQVLNGGVRQIPIATFMALALGFVVAGQLHVLKTVIGVKSQTYAGGAMVTVVIRELGCMAITLLALARNGTAMVGAARVKGEITALQAAGVDPVHYLVVPRVIGQSLSVFCLAFGFNVLATVSAYLFMYALGFTLPLGEYLDQLSTYLRPLDFLFLIIKPALFGAVVGCVCCQQGLMRPTKLEHIASATTTAVVVTLVVCVLLNGLFVGLFYLV